MRIVVAFSLLIAAALCGASMLRAHRIPLPAQGSQKKHVTGGLIPPNAGVKQPPPPVETPTTLTFYENTDRTGASYSVKLQPPVQVQATLLVPTSTLASAGLAGKVSAVRIQCGTRFSRASLFDIDWSQSSSGTMIECAPGLTTDLNLASITNPRTLDNKINAAALVDHVRTSDNKTHYVPFSTFLSAVWKTQVQNLGSGATAKTTYIWLDDFQDIHVQQFLQLSSFWCSSRGAVFDIRINVSAANFKPVFKVYGISQYVDSGFGDAWGCHDGYGQALSAGVASASAKLEAQLPQLVPGTSSGIYYFAPEGSTQDYDLFYWQ